MAIACDFGLLRPCIFAELGTIFLARRWNADTRQVSAFRLILRHNVSPIKSEKAVVAIRLISITGSASTVGKSPFSDFVAELLNASH